MTKRQARWVLAGCAVVFATVLVLAVVLNKREAQDFAEHGTRATATVERTYTWTESTGNVDDVHECVAVSLPGRSLSSCDRGIDRIFDTVQPGDPIRIVYKDDDFVLEDWADGRVTSF